jgi:acetylornithine/N-succinyldiaminopimelate aminotransferase
LNGPSKEIIKAAGENGLILIGAGEKVLRLVPPLVIEIEQLKEAMTILESILLKHNWNKPQ